MREAQQTAGGGGSVYAGDRHPDRHEKDQRVYRRSDCGGRDRREPVSELQDVYPVFTVGAEGGSLKHTDEHPGDEQEGEEVVLDATGIDMGTGYSPTAAYSGI
jgi:hypothetical protein